MSENATAGVPECAAVQGEGDSWECMKCAQAWDDADHRPPCRQLTWAVLRDAADLAALLIEQSQRALVKAGIRVVRDQAELRRAMELRKIVAWIDRTHPPAPAPRSPINIGYVRVGMRDKKAEGADDE
jgi:hypothetical protein